MATQFVCCSISDQPYDMISEDPAGRVLRGLLRIGMAGNLRGITMRLS